MHPTLQLIVTRQDESAQRGYGGTPIPTLGHAASTFDAYRVVGIDSVKNDPSSWCLTDTDAEAALGRLIDGPIRSHKDIEAAESALRSLLLYEYVEVLVPCLKAEYENKFVGYIRLDNDERNAAAFAAFDVAPCRDLLFATEYVTVGGGSISTSSNSQSQLIGAPIEALSSRYRYSLSYSSEVANAFPMTIGAAAHFTSPELCASISKGSAGFIDEIYKRIYRPWTEVAQAVPPLHFQVALPPLMAILLSRAPTRQKMPETLKDIRAELAQARANLIEMNEMLGKTLSQADINYYSRRMSECFDAIVPEAMLTNAERRKRTLMSIFNFVKPVRQLYSVAVDPISVDRERFCEIFTSARAAVAGSKRIISRSVAAESFADLLRVESVRRSIETHFSPSEIRLLTSR